LRPDHNNKNEHGGKIRKMVKLENKKFGIFRGEKLVLKCPKFIGC